MSDSGQCVQGLTERRKPTICRASGPMAEWLRRGLQILARRFDSGSGLHFLSSENSDPARFDLRGGGAFPLARREQVPA